MKTSKLMSIANKVYGLVMVPGYVYLGTGMFVYSGVLDAIGRIWDSEMFKATGAFTALLGKVCIESAADILVEL